LRRVDAPAAKIPAACKLPLLLLLSGLTGGLMAFLSRTMRGEKYNIENSELQTTKRKLREF
jgi:hypothetical protein